MSQTKEKQYQVTVDMIEAKGHLSLSMHSSATWMTDPKHLVFTLSRHKFVAKMLSGYNRVLEVGCGDGFASRLLHPEIGELHSFDFDPIFIDDARKHVEPDWPVTFAVHDILDGPYQEGGLFDAAFSLDVFEHIQQKDEDCYLENISLSLKPNGVFICGSPSLESQVYASQGSKEGHVNCKTGNELKSLTLKHFEHAFLFGMNDEVLHTGYSPMCHYLFILATGPIISK